LPVIADPATQVSALKTGVVDHARSVPKAYWDMLDRTAPELKKTEFEGSSATGIWFRSDMPPFDDVNVRRAMMIGTNIEEHRRLAEISGPLHWFPMGLADPHTFQPEELPEDVRSLYEYDPELAKQMLTDALGPPDADGIFFKTKAMANNARADWLDLAALIKDQWAKIGVEVEIDSREAVAYWKAIYPTPTPTYTGVAAVLGTGWYDPLIILGMHFQTGGGLNYGAYSDPELDEQMGKINLEVDPVERTRLVKEASLTALRKVPLVPLYLAENRCTWWPWVKNYYGEVYPQDDACVAMLTYYMWLDQDLKTDMGY
jgi:peptide/nickel transport system substrate-binding protein